MKKLEEQFPLYAPNFPVWSSQANGMLQISLWSALREKGIAAEAAGRPSGRFLRFCLSEIRPHRAPQREGPDPPLLHVFPGRLRQRVRVGSELKTVSAEQLAFLTNSVRLVIQQHNLSFLVEKGVNHALHEDRLLLRPVAADAGGRHLKH